MFRGPIFWKCDFSLSLQPYRKPLVRMERALKALSFECISLPYRQYSQQKIHKKLKIEPLNFLHFGSSWKIGPSFFDEKLTVCSPHPDENFGIIGSSHKNRLAELWAYKVHFFAKNRKIRIFCTRNARKWSCNESKFFVARLFPTKSMLRRVWRQCATVFSTKSSHFWTKCAIGRKNSILLVFFIARTHSN